MAELAVQNLVERLELDARVLRRSKRTALQVIAGDVEAAIAALSATAPPAAQVPGRPELLRSVVMAGARWGTVVRWLRAVIHG